MATTNFVNGTVVQADWLNDVDAHVYDQVLDAHDAANISFVPAGTVTSTTVQAAIEEVSAEAAAATIASNVVFTPTGTIAATDVQAAIAELDTQVSDNLTATNTSIDAVKIQNQATVATTSGTSIDITGIPAGIKRLMVRFIGVGTSGTAGKKLQLGTSAGVYTSALYSRVNAITTGSTIGGSGTATEAGWLDASSNSANRLSGPMALELADSATNTWVLSAQYVTTAPSAGIFWIGGFVALPGVIDRIRLTTGNGTDTFTAGSISLAWEF